MAYRLIALALAVTVSASPALAAICEAVCAAPAITADGSGCHERGVPDASLRLVAGVHTCGHDGLLPEAPGSRAEQPLQLSMTPMSAATPIATPAEPSILLPGGARRPDVRTEGTPLRI